MASEPATVHRLKVTLRYVKPPIWRRIEVPSDIELSRLAPVLEAAFGWLGGHLHAFESGGVRYQWPDPEFDPALWLAPVVDERTARLGDVLVAVKSRMQFEYDFGDGWEHDVIVEAIEPATAGVRYPICLAGRRAGPPDDSGGPWGYDNMLAAMRDPSHAEHANVMEWLPPGFDPEHFDISETTDMMRSPRPLYEW